jgi:hypothetical protein
VPLLVGLLLPVELAQLRLALLVALRRLLGVVVGLPRLVPH